MRILEIIVPVIFMIALGFGARATGYITREQADGAKNIAFKVLFPFLIYNATFHAELRADYILIIAYIYVAYVALMFLCGRLGQLHGFNRTGLLLNELGDAFYLRGVDKRTLNTYRFAAIQNKHVTTTY